MQETTSIAHMEKTDMRNERANVSYVLLTYNQERYVQEAIEAAFSQTYSPMEIIISDDASSDDTFEIIRKLTLSYKGNHKVVILQNQSNLGLGAHLKKVLKMTSGDWIVMAAGDDISMPHRTVAIMDAVQKNRNAGCVWSKQTIIDSIGLIVNQQNDAVGGFVVTGSSIDDSLNVRPKRLPIHATGCAAAWLRDVIMMNDYIPDGCWCEDLFYSFRCMALGRDLMHIEDSLVKYRRHDDNISGFCRETVDEANKTIRLRKHTISTLQFVEEDILMIAYNGDSGIDPALTQRLLDRIRMTVLKLEFECDILGGGPYSFSKVLYFSEYYSRKELIVVMIRCVIKQVTMRFTQTIAILLNR
jgi:glycosyltransferase involved in cell wall biosynthesis